MSSELLQQNNENSNTFFNHQSEKLFKTDEPSFRSECVLTPPPDCATIVYQTMEVCVPVTVTPSASVGKIIVKCCGPAVVSTIPCLLGGSKSYTFYVRRTICTIIPVTFNTSGYSGATSADFGIPNQTGCNCDININDIGVNIE